MKAEQLIIACDYSDPKQALALIEQLDPKDAALKVGSELFTRAGPDFLRTLVKQGYRIFLDLKFHDIPNTVAQACRAAADLGVWMLNVHASGGLAMLEAARRAVDDFGPKRPYLIAVTLLTSLSQKDLDLIGINASLEEQVLGLALLAQSAGLDGVVCSAWEVESIKARCGQGFLTVTPGIRFAKDALNDQARVMTPEQALAAGADYLVLGRSIRSAANPAAELKALLSS